MFCIFYFFPSYVPLSLKADGIPSNQLNEFQQQVLTAVEPLVHCLLQNHDFVLEITKTDGLGNTFVHSYNLNAI